jgi:hypothetical protein
VGADLFILVDLVFRGGDLDPLLLEKLDTFVEIRSGCGSDFHYHGPLFPAGNLRSQNVEQQIEFFYQLADQGFLGHFRRECQNNDF